MASINEIRGLEESIRHDARNLAGKLNMAMSIEREFIDTAKAVLGRFASVDKADMACRKAVYELTDCTENYFDLVSMLNEHEKKLKDLEHLLSYVGGWERDFK